MIASTASAANPCCEKSPALLMFRHLPFLANFGVAKVLIYAVPLIIAAWAPAEVYGAIEFGWAFALIAASALTGAALSGVNQRYLVRGERQVSDELALYVALPCLITILAWAASGAAGLSNEWQLAIASLGVAIIHNTVATLYRMKGARILTSWADGTATLFAGAIVATILLLGTALSTTSVTQAYLLTSGIAGIIALFIFMRKRQSGIGSRIALSFTIGAPMLAGGMLAMWLGVGGRMMIGMLSPEHLAAYSVTFRFAGLALGIHQLAVTALFARIYSARTRAADRILWPFLLGVGGLNAAIALVAAPLAGHFQIAALDGGGVAVLDRIIPIVCLQVFFWIAFAMLQMRINRAGLAKRALIPLLWVTVPGTALIYGAARLFSLGIIGLCWAIALQAAAYFAAEYWVLARARLPHVRVGMAALASGAVLTLIGVINLVVRGAA